MMARKLVISVLDDLWCGLRSPGCRQIVGKCRYAGFGSFGGR